MLSLTLWWWTWSYLNISLGSLRGSAPALMQGQGEGKQLSYLIDEYRVEMKGWSELPAFQLPPFNALCPEEWRWHILARTKGESMMSWYRCACLAHASGSHLPLLMIRLLMIWKGNTQWVHYHRVCNRAAQIWHLSRPRLHGETGALGALGMWPQIPGNL